MAGKKQNIDETAGDVPAVEEIQQTAPSGPPDSDYCILVNKQRHALSCPLRDGTHVNLGPKCVGRTIHISGPVLKKLRTDHLFAWEKLGWLEFREYKGGE